MPEIKRPLIVAAIFYFFIAPFFFHPDIKIIYYLSQFLSQGTVNIYQYIAANPDKALLGSFVYPPLSYFVMGLVYPVVNFLAGSGFTPWLGMGNDAVDIAGIFRYLFLIKTPLILALLATGWALSRISSRRVVLWIWFFNPITIYVVGFMGQIDILPVLLSVLALLLAKPKPFLAAVLLGLGAALKTYPLLLLPFLALLSTSNLKRSALIFLAGLSPYILLVAPFLTTPAFYSDTLTSGLTQRVLQLSLPLGYSENLYLVPIVLTGLLLAAGVLHRGQIHRLSAYWMAASLLPVVLSHFHPQWILWSMPFISLWIASKSDWLSLLLFSASFLATVFLFADKFLTWGLISPFNPQILFLPAFSNPLLQSLSHSVLVGVGLWISLCACFSSDRS
ncbi:MAG: glycosyltransferase 87 family protein [Patescibacteria group bacterium]